MMSAFAACFTAAEGAHAEPPPGEQVGSGGSRATAAAAPGVRDAYRRAVQHFKAGRYEEAYRGFLEVWAQEKQPKVAGNLGRTELKLGKYRDAAEHLALFLREDADLGEEDRKVCAAQLAEAKARIVTLRVEVVSGAAVSVDGALVGTAPMDHELYVEPGRHEIEARLGGRSARRHVDAPAGTLALVAGIDLTAPPPSVPVAPRVSVPVAPPASPPEKRRAEQTSPLRPVLVAGGAGVGVAGGVLMGIAAGWKDQAHDIVPSDGCFKKGVRGVGDDPCPRIRSLAASADTVWGAGMGMLLTGVAGAALSLVWPGATGARPPSSKVIPSFGADGVGVAWSGAF